MSDEIKVVDVTSTSLYNQFGGDVNMVTYDSKDMTNDDKVNFTLRITKSVDQKITEASSEMGVSKNAFILMILSEKFTKERISN